MNKDQEKRVERRIEELKEIIAQKKELGHDTRFEREALENQRLLYGEILFNRVPKREILEA